MTFFKRQASVLEIPFTSLFKKRSKERLKYLTHLTRDYYKERLLKERLLRENT